MLDFSAALKENSSRQNVYKVSIEDRIKNIISGQMGISSASFGLDSTFHGDLGTDSLDDVELIFMVEEEFNIQITDDEAAKLNTVLDMINHVTNKIPPFVRRVRKQKEILTQHRISFDDAFMGVAYVLSLRSTCIRRNVGCVLIDKRNHILATGYNGNAAGDPHCIDKPCAGANLASGTGLDRCEAIHAEQNALEQCSNVWAIETLYCTTIPCMHCAKMLRNTSLKRVVYIDSYPDAEAVLTYFAKGGIEVIQYEGGIRADFHTPKIPPTVICTTF